MECSRCRYGVGSPGPIEFDAHLGPVLKRNESQRNLGTGKLPRLEAHSEKNPGAHEKPMHRRRLNRKACSWTCGIRMDWARWTGGT